MPGDDFYRMKLSRGELQEILNLIDSHDLRMVQSLENAPESIKQQIRRDQELIRGFHGEIARKVRAALEV